METFHWEQYFETGISDVDEQHHKLVNIINKFGDLLAQDTLVYTQIEIIFKELVDYTVYHFEKEEAVMINNGIDDRHFKQHKLEHEKFLEEVTILYSHISPQKLDSSRYLLEYLINWLASHILGLDQIMAKQIREIKSGKTPSKAFEDNISSRDKTTEALLSALKVLLKQVSKRNKELISLNLSLEEKVNERTKELQLLNLQLEQKVFDKTLELRKLNEDLENRVEAGIAEIKKSEKNLKATNDKLNQKKKELETIINEAPNPIMMHNEDGKILLVNKTWEITTGYTHKDTDTIDKWTKKAYSEKMSVAKSIIANLYESGQRLDGHQIDVTTKNGNILNWQLSSAPLGLIDGKRTIITSAMDITELKQKDEMIINQSRLAAMGEMISMIAHQWRQPLSLIAMHANNMLVDIELENFNTIDAKKYANSITEQTQNLSHTIDDFRNFFKPDKELIEVNIEEIIDKTLSIVQDSLKNSNIELTTLFETDIKVKAYPRELMQVFVNIINNSKDSLISNKPENALLSIRVYEDDKYINTEICDNGCGIKDDILPKVFDPYFSTKDEKNGTGLGLYMSKMIIENHLSGIIEANNKDKGACFTVKLLKEEIKI